MILKKYEEIIIAKTMTEKIIKIVIMKNIIAIVMIMVIVWKHKNVKRE